MEVEWKTWQLSKPSRHKVASVQMAREADMVLQHLGPQDRLVILDQQGRAFTSESLANWLGEQYQQGRGRLIFLVGGAYGLHPDLQNKAMLKLKLSEFTFPHQLALLILAEQLYRALSIQEKLPYHH